MERITDLTIEIKEANFNGNEETQLKEIIKENIKEFDFNELKPIYAENVKKLIEQKAEGKEIKIEQISTKELDDSKLIDSLKLMRRKIKQKIEEVVE